VCCCCKACSFNSHGRNGKQVLLSPENTFWWISSSVCACSCHLSAQHSFIYSLGSSLAFLFTKIFNTNNNMTICSIPIPRREVQWISYFHTYFKIQPYSHDLFPNIFL
jgi:hypothetical protein